jgi:hypothetical protein
MFHPDLPRRRRLAGIFSERDLLTRVIGERRDLSTTRVGEVATGDVVTIDAEQPVRSVVETFVRALSDTCPSSAPAAASASCRRATSSPSSSTACRTTSRRRVTIRNWPAGTDPYDHIGRSYGR